MSLLDPKFKYTPAVATDIRKTFARVRRKLERQRPKQKLEPAPQVFRLRRQK